MRGGGTQEKGGWKCMGGGKRGGRKQDSQGGDGSGGNSKKYTTLHNIFQLRKGKEAGTK